MRMKFIKDRSKFISESNGSEEMDVPKIIMDINDIFNEYKFKLYLVGGSVRDFKTGETPDDFDIATDAKPKEVIDMLIDKFGERKKRGGDSILNNGWRINLQGESFAVVVLYIPGEDGIEIASFNTRHDGEIVLGASLEDDVNRRDITFNALFYDLDTKKVIDLVGGVDDLKNKRLKMVGDPMKRISEDPLRIQRLFRFGPRYGAEMDDETKEAIHKLKHLYREPSDERPNGVSQERIVEEFMKSFKSLKDFNDYIDYINEFGMWDILFPGISFDKSPKVVNTKSLPIMMSQLLIDEDDKILKSVMIKEWKFPTELSNKVRFLIGLSRVNKDKEAMGLKQFQIRFGIDNDLIEEFISIMGITNPLVSKIMKYDPSEINSIEVMGDLNIDHVDGKLSNPKRDGVILGQELSKKRLELFKSL